MGELLRGRDDELAFLRGLIEGEPGSAILTGGAGAGKTALWEAACELAADRGQRVLVTRARDAEASLAFAGLGDLLADIDRSIIAALPGPQRVALEAALLIAEPPDGRDVTTRTVGVALLAVLRDLASTSPVLVAVDDAQWLDRPSAEALTFAARRLAGIDVRLLVTQRTDRETDLATATDATSVEVGPLASDAIGGLLADRLGLSLPRNVLAEVNRMSHGNPLFALEVGRIMLRDGIPSEGEPLPHPEVVDELFDARVAELPADVHRIVLAAALSARSQRSELEQLASEDAVHAALTGGLLEAEGDRLRLAHPLFGSAAVRAARPKEKRAVHTALAEVAGADPQRARHLALAAEGPDLELAAYLAGSASRASARGAPTEAVDLAEHALRLTPETDPTRSTRVLELGDHLMRAGDATRATDLLRAAEPSLTEPAERARAHLLLFDGSDLDTVGALEAQIELALAEEISERPVRARALARRATTAAVLGVKELEAAAGWAGEARRVAQGTWPDVEHDALSALAWTRALRGRPLDDLVAAAGELEEPPSQVLRSVERVVALRHEWRGEIAESRATLQRLLAAAEDRGDDWGNASMCQHLVELELRAGDCGAATAALALYEARMLDSRVLAPMPVGMRAQLAAAQGNAAEAERCAVAAIADAEAKQNRWTALEASRVRGIGALAAGDQEAAADHLWLVSEYTREQQVGDPGVFPVAADLTEALLGVERLDDATAATDHVAALAAEHDHPWGLISVRRARAMIALARGEAEDDAAAELAAVAAAYAELGLGHDHARTLLALGRAQRRRRKWGDARRALESAAAAFAAGSAEGWADLSRAELERVSARRPPADPEELTPAERRVVELAAAGLANKAIAQSLVVSISTVEAHLTRAYRKLGVSSRNQLAGRIGLPKGGDFSN